MSETEEDKNFSYKGDLPNKTVTRTLDSGNKGLPPKINPADFTISATNQVVANKISSNTPPLQDSSGSDNETIKKE